MMDKAYTEIWGWGYMGFRRDRLGEYDGYVVWGIGG